MRPRSAALKSAHAKEKQNGSWEESREDRAGLKYSARAATGREESRPTVWARAREAGKTENISSPQARPGPSESVKNGDSRGRKVPSSRSAHSYLANSRPEWSSQDPGRTGRDRARKHMQKRHP